MHYPIEAIPPQAELDGMAVSCTTLPRGFDFDLMFRGLPNNVCPCPHWGYLLKGRITVKYDDGSHEEIKAGEVYYLKAGHTASNDEDCVSIDFSPIGPWQQLMQHLAATTQAV